MKLTRFRTQYDTTKTLNAVIKCTEEERRTKSEFADDCDINLIVSRFKKTGMLPQARDAAQAIFGDFAAVPSRAEMHDLVLNAHDAFAKLPAAVRKEFDNNPLQFLAASETPQGVALLKKHGLGKPEAPTPSKAAPPASAGQADPPGNQATQTEGKAPKTVN